MLVLLKYVNKWYWYEGHLMNKIFIFEAEFVTLLFIHLYIILLN